MSFCNGVDGHHIKLLYPWNSSNPQPGNVYQHPPTNTRLKGYFQNKDKRSAWNWICNFNVYWNATNNRYVESITKHNWNDLIEMCRSFIVIWKKKYTFENIQFYSTQSHSRLELLPYGRLWMKHDFCIDLLSIKERHDLVILTKCGIDPQFSIFLKFALIKHLASIETKNGTGPMASQRARKTPLFLSSCFLREIGSLVWSKPWCFNSSMCFNDSSVKII